MSLERWYLEYQPPVHTTVPRLRAALKRLHNARTSQTKHTQPITRSHGLPDVLWITRVGLDLAEWYHFVPGIYGPYHGGGHAVGGPNMVHIRYLCTTITNYRSVKHCTALGLDDHDAPTSLGTQFSHCEE